MTKKLAPIAAAMALTALFSLALAVPSAHAVAGKKVDCDGVMAALNSGRKPKDVALEMSISRGSVYRCRKKATMAGGAPAASPVASPTASPAAHAAVHPPAPKQPK